MGHGIRRKVRRIESGGRNAAWDEKVYMWQYHRSGSCNMASWLGGDVLQQVPAAWCASTVDSEAKTHDNRSHQNVLESILVLVIKCSIWLVWLSLHTCWSENHSPPLKFCFPSTMISQYRYLLITHPVALMFSPFPFSPFRPGLWIQIRIRNYLQLRIRIRN